MEDNLERIKEYVCPYCGKKEFPSVFRDSCMICSNKGIGTVIDVSKRISQLYGTEKKSSLNIFFRSLINFLKGK